jgi:hypothetical protein
MNCRASNLNDLSQIMPSLLFEPRRTYENEFENRGRIPVGASDLIGESTDVVVDNRQMRAGDCHAKFDFKQTPRRLYARLAVAASTESYLKGNIYMQIKFTSRLIKFAVNISPWALLALIQIALSPKPLL